MFETSGDILNVVLAISIGFVALFLSIALFQAIFVLRDVNELTRVLKKTAKKTNDILIQPTKFLAFLFSKAKTIANIVEKQVEKHSNKK